MKAPANQYKPDFAVLRPRGRSSASSVRRALCTTCRLSPRRHAPQARRRLCYARVRVVLYSDLLQAASDADPATVADLLDRGADIAARGDEGGTPLHRAAAHNADPAIAALLLDRGADIAAGDIDGWTPLHWAASNQSGRAVVAYLLDRGADIEARDGDGRTPLHAASDRPRPQGRGQRLRRKFSDLPGCVTDGATLMAGRA